MFQTQAKRPAIAMIELIFAIVIFGIVLMSAPMLMSTASKSGFVAIQQEAINAAATKVNMIMGYHWDESSADELFLDPILRVTSGHNDLDAPDVNASRRIGTPNESYRSFVRSDGADDLNASLLSTFGTADAGETDEDDIDDFHGSSTLTLIEDSDSDYVEDNTTITINTVIAYNSDTLTPGSDIYNQNSITFDPFTAGADTTNIKSIIVTLGSSSGLDELKKTIILRAFSCNIGGYKLEEKDVN